MSIARHHAEWLSLLETSGPFLSMPVLLEAFPQGLDAHDADHHRMIRVGHGEWEDNRLKPATHAAWVRYVLARSLDYSTEVLAAGQAIPQTLQAEVPEHRELLRPDFVLHERADTNKPRLLIQSYPQTQDLSRPVPGLPWKASPDTRMAHLLHATGVRLGLVTNGERWMLVNAPRGETTGFASWYATLWLEEPVTFRAFRTLLGVQRFFGVKDEDSPEQLLARSAANQQEVTDQLGYQVRRAVEVLIQSLDRADQDRGRELLQGVREADLYEASLTVMMRLVFLFCAEERELLLLGDPIYDQHLAVSTIREHLQQTASQYGEEILERRHDAWCRLLVAFRAVHGGVWHDDLKVPAYGGRLFDPDRFPFLEGRKPGTSWRATDAVPLPVNNRTVLHLLESLQTLETRLPGDREVVRRRLSFRSLDIEQIGHVYEGLLDHTACRATEPHLGLAGTKDKEPEVPLAELEARKLKGDKELLAYLKEATGKSEPALKKLLAVELDAQKISRFRAACQGDDGLWKRVQPFAGLVRADSFGHPVVIPTGSVYVTEGTDRRSSGTHYTPRSLTEPIVQYTLEPLVYAGPAEGSPRGEWKLKPARELLDLKVCDMACGSGAFLVQACRYLAERLQEAWQQEEQRTVGHPRVAPEGMPSAGAVAERVLEDDRSRQIEALRLVAQRCLYGVDKNPLAVEMAKLSLWLLTLAKDRPFEFLDHAVRCGDSLVGIRDLKQLEHFNLDPEATIGLFQGPLAERVAEAIALRQRLTAMRADTIGEVEAQARLMAEADEKVLRLRLAADLLLAPELIPLKGAAKAERIRLHANKAGYYVESGTVEEFRQEARAVLTGHQTFHWPLEFPEVVVDRGGFDVVIGNPPWGQKVIDADPVLRAFLQQYYPSSKGIFDLFRPFTEQATRLVRVGGGVGLVLPDILLLKNYPATRKHLLDTMQLSLLSWHAMPFTGAVIDAVAVSGWVTSDEPKRNLAVRRFSPGNIMETSVAQDDFRRSPGYEFNLHLTHQRKTLLASLAEFPSLSSFFEAHEGVHSGNIRADLFVGQRTDDSCRELYFGRDEIRPHRLAWAGRFIRLSAIPPQKTKERYANAGKPEWYSQPKVLVRRTGDFVLAAADDSGRYASNNFFVVLPCADCSLDIYGLAALLNSRFMTWYYRSIVPRQGRAFAELKIRHLQTFPLPRQVAASNGCDALNAMGRQRSLADGDGASHLGEAIDQMVDELFDIKGWNEEGEPR